MNPKLIVAALVAVLGVTLAVRTFWNGSTGTSKTAAVEQTSTPTEEVEELLTGSYDTVPTPETIDADIHRAETMAKSVAMSARMPSVSASQREDLAIAFRERLESMINPEYMRDLRARVARGQPGEVVEPSPEQLKEVNAWKECFALLPMDIQSLEVRPIYQRGVYVAESMTANGFAEGTTTLGGDKAFPMSGLDPEEDGLDIVEVLMPMAMPVATNLKEKSRGYVGFQFVWSPPRKQWIPWANKNYHDPEIASIGLPF